MQLPKIASPEYPLELPLSKKKIKFRPFKVAEEKILLTALEGFSGKDAQELTSAILTVIQACILTKDVDAAELPSLDVEFLFMNMRKKSVGEVVDFLTPCKKCGKENHVKINLNNTKLVIPENHNNKIFIRENMGVVMKYPTLEFSLNNIDKTNKVETMFEIIIDSIDIIFNGDDFSKADAFERKALKAWIESFDPADFKKLYNFFETMPSLSTKTTFQCSSCGENNDLEVNGATDFFV